MLRIAAVTLLAARLAAVSADDYEYVTEGSIKCDSDGDGTATSADLLFNYENMDVEACNDACQCSSGCCFFSVNPASNKCRGYAACDSYAASDGASTHQIYRKVGCTAILNPYTTFGNPPPDGIPCSSTADCPTSGDCAANPVCWTHESLSLIHI